MQRLLAFALLLGPAAALAQATPTADSAANSQYASLLPLVFIFVIFYVLLIRPQQRRMKEHQVMLGELAKGDEVVTGGGIVGKISKVNEDGSMVVEIAKGVEVTVLKSTVSARHGVVALVKPTAADKKLAAAETKKLTAAEKKKNDNRVPSRDSVANDN